MVMRFGFGGAYYYMVFLGGCGRALGTYFTIGGSLGFDSGLGSLITTDSAGFVLLT
jgi:hypothetical protein